MIPFAADTSAETGSAFEWTEQPIKIASSRGPMQVSPQGRHQVQQTGGGVWGEESPPQSEVG